jgi:hypothetical protein
VNEICAIQCSIKKGEAIFGPDLQIRKLGITATSGSPDWYIIIMKKISIGGMG